MTPGACEKCAAWECDHERGRGGETYGYCHRHAPVAKGDDRVFPLTYMGDWCMEFLPIPTPEARSDG